MVVDSSHSTAYIIGVVLTVELHVSSERSSSTYPFVNEHVPIGLNCNHSYSTCICIFSIFVPTCRHVHVHCICYIVFFISAVTGGVFRIKYGLKPALGGSLLGLLIRFVTAHLRSM